MPGLAHTGFLLEDWGQPNRKETSEALPGKAESGSGETRPSFSFALSEHTGVSLRNLLNMLYTYGPLLNRAIGSSFYVSFALIDAMAGQKLTDSDSISEIRRKINGDFGYGIDPADTTVHVSGIVITDDAVYINGFAPMRQNGLTDLTEEEYMETCRQLAESINRAAISSKRVQARKIPSDNDKYFLHLWLDRLGMKGSEYKTARNVLMQMPESVMYQKENGQGRDTDDRPEKTTGHENRVKDKPEQCMDITTEGLPSEILLQIMAIDDFAELERLKSAANKSIGDFEKQIALLEQSVSGLDSDVKSIMERIGKLQEQLQKKQAERGSAQTALDEAKRDCAIKTQEASALAKQEKTLKARSLFDAFVASGKSMEEILGFLRGNTEQASSIEMAGVISEKSTMGSADKQEKTSQAEKLRESETAEDIPPFAFGTDDISQANQDAPEDYPEETQIDQKKPVGKRGAAFLSPEQETGFLNLWHKIENAQGETFETVKGQPFRYEMKDCQIHVDRKGKPITQGCLRHAFQQVKDGEAAGPGSLKTFGASYVWSIFKKFGILAEADKA